MYSTDVVSGVSQSYLRCREFINEAQRPKHEKFAKRGCNRIIETENELNHGTEN